MNDITNIGITGPSGAGKSTISKIIEEYGYKILDADLIARDTINSNPECLHRLSLEFGKEAVAEGKLNRKYVAKLAFESKERLNILNDITHPYILQKIENEVLKLNNLCNNILIDAAVLFESGLNKLCNYVISVLATKEIRIKRIMDRDKLSFEEASRRINAQNEDDFYISNSEYILDGTKSIILLQEDIKKIILRGLR